ncbi:MAG: nitroreductase [Oscillospiraceae bacterium]|nr:nitroreductase [Oscillospiraceae bacterium]
MNEIIRKRKSVRKYEMTSLDEASLEMVREQIKKVKPLYPNIGFSVETTNKTKGMFNIKAPHYLVFRSEDKEGAEENIGFIGQQLDLFLAESGLGTCWLGASKPEDRGVSALPSIICMSFGKPNEPLYRELSEFKRKTLADISEGIDERLEAARLAPSGMNMQAWFFVAENGKIHCYRKKQRLGFMNKMACVDMGIAICHIAEESEDFQFAKEVGITERKGYIYMGTVNGK